MPIQWLIKKKRLAELKPYEDNPRRLTDKGMADLKESIDKFGMVQPIVLNKDGTVIGGHARYHYLKEKGELMTECYIASRQLTDEEVKELNIRLNKNVAGEWDFDMLANRFSQEDLLSWGFEPVEFGIFEGLDEGRLMLDKPEGTKDQTKDGNMIKCPACGYEF